MRIELKKFGTTLISRPTGNEAIKVFLPTLKNMRSDEELVVDFSGVLTFSPSWGDEFLSPLLDQFGDRLILLASDNLSVQTTLNLLQEIKKRNFVMR